MKIKMYKNFKSFYSQSMEIIRRPIEDKIKLMCEIILNISGMEKYFIF